MQGTEVKPSLRVPPPCCSQTQLLCAWPGQFAPLNPKGLGLITLVSCWPASCADPVRMVKSGKTPLVKQGVALMAENAKILNTLTTGEAETPCTLSDARCENSNFQGSNALDQSPLTAQRSVLWQRKLRQQSLRVGFFLSK